MTTAADVARTVKGTAQRIRERVVEKTDPAVAETVPVSKENLRVVQAGMRSVCTSGTAAAVFGHITAD